MPIEEFDTENTGSHVVIIGGKAADDEATRWLCSELLLPQAEEKRYEAWDSYIFRFDEDKRTFEALFKKKTLIGDVGVFARGRNPGAHDLTVTVCNGITSRGVHGAALCFADSQRSSNESLRKVRNEQYVKDQMGGASTYCIFMNIKVLKGKAVAPDLSRQGEVWCYKQV